MIFAFLFPLSPSFVIDPFGRQNIYVTINAISVFMKYDFILLNLFLLFHNSFPRILTRIVA